MALSVQEYPRKPPHLVGRVIGHYLLQFLYIVVTIATLVEPQGPVRGHVGAANDLLVLLNHCLWLRAKEEVEI